MIGPEEAVIGACLLSPDVIPLATKHVMPSDFQTWQGEQIFEAILWLRAAKTPVDIITVGARLAAAGSRVDISALHNIIAEVPTAANVEYYAAQVREASVRRGLHTVAVKLVQEADDDRILGGVALANAMAGLQAVRDDAPYTATRGKTLGEIMAAPADYDWVIKHFLERGDRLILTGGEGAGKSMLVRQMAVFAAAGIHPFWLHKIDPVRVVVLDRENSERQWRRKADGLFKLAVAHGTADPSDMYVECDDEPLDITRATDLGRIHRILDENPADILFIGPLYKLVPRAIMSDDDAAPLLSALDSLRGRGCAIVTEAHAGHDRGASLRPVGSSAFLRWPEFGRGIRQNMAIEGQYDFEKWRGDRDERAFPSSFTRGEFVPWVAEGVSPGVLERFRHTQPPLGGENGF